MADTSLAKDETRILETASDIQERRNQVLGRFVTTLYNFSPLLSLTLCWYLYKYLDFLCIWSFLIELYKLAKILCRCLTINLL